MCASKAYMRPKKAHMSLVMYARALWASARSSKARVEGATKRERGIILIYNIDVENGV